MRVTKATEILLYVALLTVVAGSIWLWRITRYYHERITIEAHYMRYACGDKNDDMKVVRVGNDAFAFIVDKDIDPEAGYFGDGGRLGEYFSDNHTTEYGYNYRLTGYLSKCSLAGCDGVPTFMIEEVSRMDGKNKRYKNDFR